MGCAHSWVWLDTPIGGGGGSALGSSGADHFSPHVTFVGLQIFSKEEREKRRAKLKVRCAAQITRQAALAEAPSRAHMMASSASAARLPRPPLVLHRSKIYMQFVCCCTAGGDAARLL